MSTTPDHSIAIGHFLDSHYSLEFEAMHIDISRKLEASARLHRHEAFYVMAVLREFEGAYGGADAIQRKHLGPREKSMVCRHDALVRDLLDRCIG